jgi:hypothetical protein
MSPILDFRTMISLEYKCQPLIVLYLLIIGAGVHSRLHSSSDTSSQFSNWVNFNTKPMIAHTDFQASTQQIDIQQQA